ncbi:TlpA family protein disulfide reductase [Undibacterium sp. LX15W]|uniref:TlpA family protein disulfide reductase n=2 Tax=Undibacterium flavidum TaxID=2762297 RepID=A0ABR6Y957_9BURK|nr:TlpA family protein disulfide reductase [Undibacterium flavidum]
MTAFGGFNRRHIRLSWWQIGLSLILAFPLISLAQETLKIEPVSAPAFELTAENNSKHQLKHYLGKLVYIDFWASWCAPCLQSFPFMNSMQQKYQAAGLQIVAINLDKKMDDAQIFLKKNPAQFLVLFDPEGKTPLQYAVKGMPSSYLLDRSGKIIFTHKGFKAADQALLEAKIRTELGLKN